MRKYLNSDDEEEIEKLSKLTLKKYRILKWRMKISCMALL